ncbi:hypothetical protein TNCV_1459721 [Trichonephila clavipes]|nr:hypothetical protein TNCV_1459721 [Trichonephila clavipes]
MVVIVHYSKLSQKNNATIALTGIVALEERRCLIRMELNTQLSKKLQELQVYLKSKSVDFNNEVLGDAASVMNLTEEEFQERILRKKKNK